MERRLRELVVELARARSSQSEPSHLAMAVKAMDIAQAADRLARGEIIAAREFDDATWADIGEAFGVSTQTAHERFRTGPDGLHSRLFKLADQPKSAGGGSTTSGRTGAGSGTASKTAKAARTARTDRS
jgi:hypothetical protein